MKLVTWNIQWCRGCDGRVDPARIVDARARLRRLRRALPAGGRRQLPDPARAAPARTSSRCSPRCCRASPRSPASPVDVAGARRLAPPLRQHDPEPAAGAQVLRVQLPWPADPAVRSMPRMLLEAVVQRAVRAAARHDDAPRVLLAARSARRRSRRCARITPRPAAHALDDRARQRFRRPVPGPAAQRLGDPHRRLQPAPRRPAARAHGRAVRRRARAGVRRRLAAAASGPAPAADGRRARPPPVARPVRLRLHLREPRPARPRLRRIAVDGATAASDHQPMLVEIDD